MMHHHDSRDLETADNKKLTHAQRFLRLHESLNTCCTDIEISLVRASILRARAHLIQKLVPHFYFFIEKRQLAAAVKPTSISKICGYAHTYIHSWTFSAERYRHAPNSA